MLIGAIVAAVIAVAMSIYSYVQMRKMQKKNRPKPNQLDGTIADEGTSFCDIAGSPHVHANITDIWGKSTQAIKKKSGGFLGIGKTSQVTGYRYYAKFAAFIGNRIEKLLGINFDNRKWVLHDPTKHPVNMLPVREGNLFGENEGGVAGDIDIHFGYPDQGPNMEYQKHFPLVSGYPYQSYLLFRGYNFQDPFLGRTFTTPAFYLGNSGYMKEMLLWVKRIHVKNDGDGQWHDSTSEIPDMGIPDSGCAFIDGRYKYNGAYWEGVGGSGEYRLLSTAPSFRFSGSKVRGMTYIEFVFDHGSAEDTIIEIDRFYAASCSSISVVTSGRVETISFVVESFDKNDVFWDRTASGVFKLKRGDVVEHKIRIYFNFIEFVSSNYPNGKVSDFYYDMWLEIPVVSGWACWGGSESPDINPIHKIREILTDDTAMAKPETDVNDQNFIKAADRIWDEGLGVSWAIDEKSCIDAIEELCYHIEAGVRVNRQTGLYEMVLFRDDWFAEDEIHEITESMIKDLSLEIMNSDDVVNQLNVTYYDRQRIKNSTFSVYENGSILTIGKANAESIDFPYFMNMRNAEIVANWKLKQYSTPAWKGTFTTGWREARKWNRYDLVKITWSKKWQGTILARIMKIDLGNGLNNEVMIDFEEVVPYSGEMNTSIVIDDSAETKPIPPQPAIFKAFEIPYYDLAQLKTQAELDLELARNPNIGFVAAVAGRPQQNSIDAQLHTESDVGYELVSSVEYASFARTDEAVNRTQQSFVVKNEDLSIQFRQDSLIMLGDEIAIYKSYDTETKTLTVERGALDTIPQNHIANTVLYFYDDAFAYDPEGYTPPKTVNATVLTTTPSGIESLETSPKRQIEIESRAIRPYPPANVKINGEYWPDEIETDLVITWSDRNRLDLNIIDWYSTGVAIEPNTQTHLTIIERDDNEVVLATSNNNVSGTSTYTMPVATMQADTRTVEIILKTTRDGYDSYYQFSHTVELSQFFSAPYDLVVEFKND
ncbi:phage tail protein [Acinetobacter indicus]|uniref:phage tail protein n=1 Tax=Acinetobacter indicus TaxID=756892 RepID=UPI00209A8408|nr:phage tail protein [Acinetobacter indicus]MCO8087262.1 phage tail protein [Acinetobacter indicus]